MIVDTFKNIHTYEKLSYDIYLGLSFLKNAKNDIELGQYKLNSRVKVFIDEYKTKKSFQLGYEGHKNVIDIQYPIIGVERIKWSPIENMEEKTPYNDKIDTTYYSNPSPQGTHVDIGNNIFAIMFPQDGHAPQYFIDEEMMIKKITVKVQIR